MRKPPHAPAPCERPAPLASAVPALTLRFLIITGLLLASPGTAAGLMLAVQSPLLDIGYEEASARLDITMDMVAALREELDRSLVDLDELAFEMAFEDGEYIGDWVSREIAFQPYAGSLRGAQGTLVSAAGNALDQALLLATLLADAGYEVRLSRGRLGEGQAQELLASAGPPRLHGGHEEYLERVRTVFDEAGDLPGIDQALLLSSLDELLGEREVDDGLYDEARQITGELVDLLGQDLGADGSLHEKLLEEASDYWWVEYRFSAADEWQAAHPAFPAIAVIPEAQEHLDGPVPAELLHRLRIEVMIERKVGDELSVLPVMDPWERPTANLTGQLITYANSPSGMEEGLEGDLPAVLAETEFFVPQINGSMATGAAAFDLEGVLLEPAVAADQAAGVFREVNRGFQEATGLLGALSPRGMGEVEDPMALTSQWLEYTLIAPDGSERSARRVLFDRVGVEERAAGGSSLKGVSQEEAELALVTEQRIMAIMGEARPEYLLDQFLARFLATRPLLDYALAITHGRTPDVSIEQALGDASPLEHLLTAQLFDAASSRVEGVLSFRAQPSLLVFSNGVRGTVDDATGFTSLDIVQNERRIVRWEGDRLVPAATAAVEMGVWETLVEREILAADGDEVWNTTTALQKARAAGSDLLLISSGSEIGGLGLSAETALNLRRDLDDGYLAVVPSRPADPESAAWWRIRAGSGETLGITGDGRGQSMLEYTIQLYDMGFTVMFAVLSLRECERKYADEPILHACCLVKAHANNVAGLALGGLLSKGFATAVVGSAGKTVAGEAGALAGLSFGVTGGLLGESSC